MLYKQSELCCISNFTYFSSNLIEQAKGSEIRDNSLHINEHLSFKNLSVWNAVFITPKVFDFMKNNPTYLNLMFNSISSSESFFKYLI